MTALGDFYFGNIALIFTKTSMVLAKRWVCLMTYIVQSAVML